MISSNPNLMSPRSKISYKSTCIKFVPFSIVIIKKGGGFKTEVHIEYNNQNCFKIVSIA